MPRTIKSPFGTIILEMDNDLPDDQDERYPRQRHRRSSSIEPATDVYETEDSYQVYIDLPGVDKDTIKTSLSGTSITVSAETKKLNLTDGHWIREERPTGHFMQTLRLGQPVDDKAIEAAYSDGTLVIKITKQSDHKRTAIEVKHL